VKYLINIYEFLNEAKIDDIYSKYYSDIDSDTFNQIVTADPTTIIKNDEIAKMGMYSKWLLSLYKNDNLLIEDLYKATDYLKTYDHLKRSNKITGREANILIFKTLPDLFKIISEVGGTGKPTDDESYLINDRFYINNGEAEIFHEDRSYLIVTPKTLEASQFYAKNTEWCTQYPDRYNQYSQQGSLFIIIDKALLNTSDTNRRLQLHFESKQYMDINDRGLRSNIKKIFYPIFKDKVKDAYVLKYDNIMNAYANLRVVRCEDLYGYIDDEGNEVTPLKYSSAGTFSNDAAIVSIRDTNNTLYISHLYGLIDVSGKETTELKYTKIHDFYNGVAIAIIKDGHFTKEGYYVFISNKGEEITNTNYSEIYDTPMKFITNGEARTVYKVRSGTLFGCVDTNGVEVVPVKLRNGSFGNFVDGRTIFKETASYLYTKCGIMDMKGNIIVAATYDKIKSFVDDRAITILNKKHGVVDIITGKEIIPPTYDVIEDYYHNGKAVVSHKRKEGLIDKNGNFLIPIEYQSVRNYSDGFIHIQKRNLYGVINPQGKQITPIKYTSIDLFRNGKAEIEFRKKGDYINGYIDTEGKESLN
jgi:hypothetical protein